MNGREDNGMEDDRGEYAFHWLEGEVVRESTVVDPQESLKSIGVDFFLLSFHFLFNH